MIARRRILLAFGAAATAGCGVFGKPSDDISFNRGQFSVVVIRLAELHGALTVLAAMACREAQTPAVVALCGELRRAEDQYQALKPQVERAITDPRTVPDWTAIIRGLEILSGVVATVSPALGLPVLGALGAVGGAIKKP